MKHPFRIIVILVILVIVGLGLFVFSARNGLLTADDATMRARYALPNSKFADIDGEVVHYVDEGSGDAVVLIHGSYASLLMWNDWAKVLSGHYRVVRFDRPPMGLSGPDPRSFYDVEREKHIIDALTTKLGIDRFFLVATSSGGISGAGYAADHPERIKGLVLSNIATGPYKLSLDMTPAFKRSLMINSYFNGWHDQEFWRQILLANFADSSKVTPAMVREWTDLNNRAQFMTPAPGNETLHDSLNRTPKDLPRISAPTLVLWSADDKDTSLDAIGKNVLPLLIGTTDKTFVVIPHCGHMMPLECGPESVAAALPFLDRLAGGGS